MIVIGVKYCGGCNPDYDRVAAVSDLARALADVARFVPASSGEADRYLVVHGCRTACADVGRLAGKPMFMTVTPGDLQDLVEKIRARAAIPCETGG